MSLFGSETETVDESQPYLLPQAGQTYSDPAVELAARNLLASYFGTPDQAGLISQQIPVPIQQIAGLSPLEIQARNLAGGLGAFGGQLAEAQEMYRQAGRGFDPASAGVFGDPQARALYMQSLGAYDPSTGGQFVDQEAREMMTGAAGDIQRAAAGIPGQIGAAQRGIVGAEGMIRGAAASSARPSQMAQQVQMDAARQAGRESDIGQAALRRSAAGIRPEVIAGQRQAAMQESGALREAQQLGRTLSGIGRQAGAGAAAGERAIGRAARGIRPEVTGAQRGSLEAVQRARQATGQAGRDLRSAGQMGRSAAERGIAALSGTGGQFDPSSIGRFMDPFTQQVIEAEQAEIARLGEKQKRDARAQAVQAGAFGGSRQGIEQAEIGRNILEQQARTGAQLRSQGYQQAAQQAQQAFEQAQGRQQNLAQLTGSLGQAGAGTSLQAAQAAGTLGLSAEELAQSGAMQRGQLGMTGRMNEAQLAEQAASLGMSADQLRAQLAQQGQAATMGARQMGQQGAIQRAQLGLTGRETEAQLAERAANMGISTEQLRAQLARQGADIAQSQAGIGMQAGQNIGSLAGQRGQLGLQGQQAMIGAAGQRADIGQALGGLGMQGQQMGLGAYEDQMRRMQGAASGLGGLTQQQFGTALQAYGAGTGAQRAGAAGIAGLGQQGYNMLTGQIDTLAGLGATGRGIQDRTYGAQYTAATQMADEPYMRLQRGQQMLGGLSGFLPQYSSGYQGGMGQVGTYQQPGAGTQFLNTVSQIGSLFG